jgi:hypothetical protein
MSHKSGNIGSIGVLTQLLQNMLNMYTIYADANIQKNLPAQDNGMNFLWCDLILEMLLLIVPGLWDINIILFHAK